LADPVIRGVLQQDDVPIVRSVSPDGNSAWQYTITEQNNVPNANKISGNGYHRPDIIK
jgi:hypothetical protein